MVLSSLMSTKESFSNGALKLNVPLKYFITNGVDECFDILF